MIDTAYARQPPLSISSIIHSWNTAASPHPISTTRHWEEFWGAICWNFLKARGFLTPICPESRSQNRCLQGWIHKGRKFKRTPTNWPSCFLSAPCSAPPLSTVAFKSKRFHTASSIFFSQPFHDIHWLASLWKFVLYGFRGAVFYLSCCKSEKCENKTHTSRHPKFHSLFKIRKKKKKLALLPLHISAFF